MFKKLFLAAALIAGAIWLVPTSPQVAWAQNTTCSNKPPTDVSNACANTRFVHTAVDPANCIVFTPTQKGCVPASGGGTLTFLRADGTFSVVAAGGGSAIVGMILPWSGATVPDTYLLAYGQAVSRVTYVDLKSVLTFTPSITCTNGSPTFTVDTEISDRVPIGAAVEASACFIAGTVVSSKGAGSLTVSNNAGASTSTTATIFPWGNGDGSTTFNMPNLMGRTMVGRDNMSGTAAGTLTSTYYGSNPDALGALGGTQSTTLVTGNLPPYTPSGSIGITDPGHFHSYLFAATIATPFACPGCVGSVNTVDTAAATNTSSATTGITAAFTGSAQGGSSTAFSRVQPSVTVDYIIKALPDSAVGDTITVDVTNVAGGAPTQVLYDNNGKVGEYAISGTGSVAMTNSPTLVTPDLGTPSAAVLTNATGLPIQGGVVWPSETTTTYGTTTTFDFATFKNTKVTLTGDITTQTLSNVVEGKAGMIRFIQDGSGGHTTVWNTVFKFSGGTLPVLTTTPDAVDILTYSCSTTTFCAASLLTDVRNP